MARTSRRRQTAGLSADQLRDALGALTVQATPRRQWVTAARGAAWRGRWWLAPLLAHLAVWATGAVIAASSAASWFAVLLLSALGVAAAALLARPLPERDRPWVWGPAVLAAAYLVATAVLGH